MDEYQALHNVMLFPTLVDILRWRAQHQQQRQAYIFLKDGEEQEEHFTYGEVDLHARRIAAQLEQMGIRPGERALLLYPSGLEYVAAVFGCFYAGVIAVPLYPAQGNARSMQRLRTVIVDAQAAAILTTRHLLQERRGMDQFPDLAHIPWIATDALAQGIEEQWQQPTGLQGATLALLQYTSGSTSQAKGVLLTHGNLLHNLSLIHTCCEHTPDSWGVTWAPPYHDMGLIGGVLQPVYGGFPVTFMSPVAFLQRPIRWLQAVSRTRATTSGGPNFAYDLCVQKIPREQRETLDLGNWSIAFASAEPIHAQSLERFLEAFGPCGFRREAFYPCYGLAEATLLVSARAKLTGAATRTIHKEALAHHRVVEVEADSVDACTLVGCGKALPSQQVVIAYPDLLTRCPPDTVGEIWVSGPSVAQGYWNNSEATQQTFYARLIDAPEQGPFLRTGDLGFFKDGELFVTGRLKDLIIIRGKNHYPQDIEQTVEQCDPRLRPAGCAAFSADIDGQERLVIVQEVERSYRNDDLEPVIHTIRRSIAEQHKLQAYAVVLVKPGGLPKTTSGKVQRSLCRDKFLTNALEVVAQSIVSSAGSSPPTDTGVNLIRARLLDARIEERKTLVAAYLQATVAGLLGADVTSLDRAQSLSELGIDSLAAIELSSTIETALGIVIPIAQILQGISISQLADEVLSSLEKPVPGVTASSALGQHTLFPLSYAQKSLWFLHQLAPLSPAYHVATAVRVRTDLNMTILRRVLQVLVDRHPSLRTTFTEVQGEPIQQIHAGVPTYFSVIDASGWAQDVLYAYLQAEARRPFDLVHGPLFRVHVFAQSSNNHVLLLVMHHIVTDFWSIAILLNELLALYAAEQSGTRFTLPPLERQYVDYVAWQREMLAGPQGAQHWEYWQDNLANAMTILNLPLKGPRPKVQRYRGSNYLFYIDEPLTTRLKNLARARGVTLYMLLLAAFQVLLYRYSGQEDILVGSPTSGRSRAAWASIVGYYINPIVLRAKFAGNLSFAAFLQQVRQTVLAAFQHQDYPFSLLVEQLQPERDASRSPLFQVMFTLQKAHQFADEGLAAFALGIPGRLLNIGGWSLESIALEQQVAQFDLSLMVAEEADGLAASLQYDTDLFAASWVMQMAEHWQTVLEGIAANPEQFISTLPLLTTREIEQQLGDWNATSCPYPHTLGIHKIFEAQVKQRPHAVALVFEDQQITYEQLDHDSNQLAHYLQSQGVGPERPVGICIERSLEMVIGLLGILKAGGAYVPLDPASPKERLAWMLEDAQVSLVLTLQRLAPGLPSLPLSVFCLDTERTKLAAYPDVPLSCEIDARHLAYVMYTSGSTGRPKGVCATHRNVVRLVKENSYAAMTPDEVFLQFAPLAFDASTFELWGALLNGARLVILSPQLPSLQELGEAIQRFHVTTLWLTAGLFHQMVDAHLTLLRPIRQLLAGGDVVSAAHARIVQQTLPACQLINGYGPTECTTFACCYPLPSDESLDSSVPIGRPIANTQAYIFDAALQLVPVGQVGELYLGGDGLARGYLNRPDLTAERFLPHPFSLLPGARLYRTGDLARYRADGTLEFLGRGDQQIKLRGMRIELGELETVLGRHPAIRDVVVTVHENFPGDKRLVAYIIADQECSPAWSDLRSYLKKHVPEYMMPSAFVFLEAFPLTANGKIDRSALPLPEPVRPDLEKAYVAPCTPMEEVIAALWAEILDIEQVGIHDNFFDLGGHSLLATQVISRLREIFPVNIPLVVLFESPTVAEFADRVLALGEAASINLERAAQLLLEVNQLSDVEVKARLRER